VDADERERLELLGRFSSVSREISALVGAAPPESWSRPSPYSAGVGRSWTTKDLLAHMVAIQKALPHIIRSGSDPITAEREPFEPDRWNAAMLRRRADTPPWSLLEEMVEATDELDSALEDVGLEAYTRVGWKPGRTLRDALGELANHQHARFVDLQNAIGLPPGAPAEG
jgi:uncharacterized protein (TIGR03083 family)